MGRAGMEYRADRLLPVMPACWIMARKSLTEITMWSLSSTSMSSNSSASTAMDVWRGFFKTAAHN